MTHSAQVNMVEKAEYQVMKFEAVPPVGLLSSMGPFMNTDVTNPRELYSILSESKQLGALETTSLSAQPSVRLPPLQTSSLSEMPLQPLRREPTQHSSYPDLLAINRQMGSSSQQDNTNLRRATSLHDVSSLDKMDGVLMSKKLTPIMRSSDSKTPIDQPEKTSFKLEKKESPVAKDQHLPPIEDKHGFSDNQVSTDADRQRLCTDINLNASLSPRLQRPSLECPRDIFPRGQPVEVKKPVTPTYDDYPEAYWELRSPTLQEPSDLKEDMINRDYYRLQQISSLHLRAMNRDIVTNKMDTYRKWQQCVQDNHLPPLAHKVDTSRTAGTWPTADGPHILEGSWKQQKVVIPVQNHTLAIAAKMISPSNNPTIKKQSDRMKNTNIETTVQTNDQTTDGEQQEQKLKANGVQRDVQKQEVVKALKASVVNLSMEPCLKSNVAAIDVQTGLRKIRVVRRPKSTTVRQPPLETDKDHNQEHHNEQMEEDGGRMSAISNDGTMSSSLSHYLQRIPSAPAATPPPTIPAVPVTVNKTKTKVTETTKEKYVGRKLILKKFNRLQVFGEKGTRLGIGSDPPTETLWSTLDMMGHRKKKPYLPQNRPPTYRLDLKNYPPRHHGSTVLGTAGDLDINMESSNCPIIVSERGGMPIVHHSAEQKDASALSFRFRDGEVIVSRQGKKCHPT